MIAFSNERATSSRISSSKSSFSSRFFIVLEEACSFLLPQVATPRGVALVLLLVQVMELVSLSIPMTDRKISVLSGYINGILKLFCLRNFISSSISFILLIIFLVFQLLFLLSLCLLIEAKKRNTIKNFGLRINSFFCRNFLRLFTPTLQIPICNLAGYLIFSSDGSNPAITIALSILTIISSVGLSIFINSLHTTYSFKLRDHLQSYPYFTQQILNFFKILIALIASVDRANNSVFVCLLFAALLTEYYFRINFDDPVLSEAYIFMLLFGFSTSGFFIIFTFINDFEPEGLIIIILPFFKLFGNELRKKFILRKLSRLNNRDGPCDANGLNILVRGLILTFSLGKGKTDIYARTEILEILLQHQNACYLPGCLCQKIDFRKKIEWKPLKALCKSIIASAYAKLLSGRSLSASMETSLLNYSAYLIEFEKFPNKALSLLFKYDESLRTFNSKVAKRIMIQKARNSIEKKLIDSRINTQDFGEVIKYEYGVTKVESQLKDFLLDLFEFMVQVQSARKDRLNISSLGLNNGYSLTSELKDLKQVFLTLMTQNPENLRVILMASRFGRLFEDEFEFSSIVKRMEMKRIEQLSARKRMTTESVSSLDLFNPKAGVVFLNMTNSIGRIEIVSKGTLAILKGPLSEVIGKNISQFMPEVVAHQHDELLLRFISSGKESLIRERRNTLFALDVFKRLVNVNVIIRVDTFLENDFLVSALMTKSQFFSKSMLCDDYGNIMHYTEELDVDLNLKTIREQRKSYLFNIIVLIPQLYSVFFPEELKGKPREVFEEELKEKGLLFVYPFPDETKSLASFSNLGVVNENLVGQGVSCSNLGTLDWNTQLITNLIKNIELAENFFSLSVDIKTIKFNHGGIKFTFLNFKDIVPIDDGFEELSSFLCKKLEEMDNKIRVFRQPPPNSESVFKKTNKPIEKANHNFDEISLESKSFYNELNRNRDKAINAQTSFEIEANESLNLNMEEKISFYQSNAGQKSTNQLSGRNKANEPGVYQQVSSFFSSRKMFEEESGKTTNAASFLKRGKFIKSMNKIKKLSHDLVPLKKKSRVKTRKLASVSFSNDSNFDDKPASEQLLAQSQGSSSVITNGNLRGLMNSLHYSKTKEIKILKFISVSSILVIMLAIFLIWAFNIASSNSLYINMKSLFDDSKQTEELFQFLKNTYDISMGQLHLAFNEKLRNTPGTPQYLLEKKIAINFVESVKDEIDMDRALGLFINFLADNGRPDYMEIENRRDSRFIFLNFRSIIKEAINIFDDIGTSNANTLSEGLNLNLWVLYAIICYLFIISVLILQLSYQIKSESTKIFQSLQNFEPEAVSLKIADICKCLRILFPEMNPDLESFVETLRFSDRSQAPLTMDSKRKQARPTSKSTHKQGPNLGITTILSHRSTEFKLEAKKAKQERAQVQNLSSKRYLTFIMLGLSLTLLGIIMVFLLNYIMIQKYDRLFTKVDITRQGIQDFSLNLNHFVTLKNVEYSLLMNGQNPENELESQQIKTYLSELKEKINRGSDPVGIFYKQEESPGLLNINTNYYFSDICLTLQGLKADINFSDQFNFQSCYFIFNGVSSRGGKALSNVILQTIVSWEMDLESQSPANISTAIKNKVLNKEEFGQLHFSLRLLQFLQSMASGGIESVLKQYMNDYSLLQNLWMSLGLIILVCMMTLMWMFLLRSLQRNYQNTMKLLGIFSTRMIIGNKMLFARISKLIKKSQ